MTSLSDSCGIDSYTDFQHLTQFFDTNWNCVSISFIIINSIFGRQLYAWLPSHLLID